jgi:molybdenum cofactor cytidylyltransferase/nicotine blue oxidoreductase
VPRIAAAVLAAGAGTRFGRPKAEVVIAGERLVDRAVAVLRAAGGDPVIAVVRPGTSVPGALVVENPEPERGQRSSLALAVSAAEGADALAVVLVDTPGIGAAAVAAVAAAWRPGRVAVGRYGTRRAHPIVMAPALWADALALAGPDEGARALLSARPELIDEVDVPGDPSDLDTPADLARWPA